MSCYMPGDKNNNFLIEEHYHNKSSWIAVQIKIKT